MDKSFDALLAEAEGHPVAGWDFSWLGERLAESRLPWDFDRIVLGHARRSPDLLDLGTGGGERLATMAYRPPRTVATEAWPPNVAVATTRLAPLGVTVVEVEPAPDNVDQGSDEARGRLPFASESFTLVSSRHESFLAGEVARILVPGGIFLTQQLGGDYGEFYDALELPRPEARPFELRFARQQFEAAGLRVVEAAEALATTTFRDAGAFAWYLKAIPWVLPGFSLAAYRTRLERLHARIESQGAIAVRQPAFWLEAAKPPRA